MLSPFVSKVCVVVFLAYVCVCVCVLNILRVEEPHRVEEPQLEPDRVEEPQRELNNAD